MMTRWTRELKSNSDTENPIFAIPDKRSADPEPVAVATESYVAVSGSRFAIPD